MLRALLSLSITAMLTAGAAMAAPVERDVLELKNKVSSFVLSMDGVNGLGVGECTSGSMKELCLSVTTENDKTAMNLKSLFPKNTRIDGVLIKIEKVGIIRLE